MTLQRPVVAKAEMLIRKPIKEVFAAFVDPAITTKFWFTKSSGKLEPGKNVRWDWEMFGVFAQVSVKAIEQNKRILIEWPTPVEWVFIPKSDNTTFVSIISSGFTGDDDQVVSQAIDSMGGFSLLLAGCKAFLEHGIMLNLVADHNPDANTSHGAAA
ncbi:MAG: SRPBCC family protein [Bacteroidota bacterium]